MHRLPLPGRTSLFTAATLTVIATVSLLASPTTRAAIDLRHLDSWDPQVTTQIACSWNQPVR